MRAHLRFLLLDEFDPDTGELALRLAFQPEPEPGSDPEVYYHFRRLCLGD